jgi:hypothetical protein
VGEFPLLEQQTRLQYRLLKHGGFWSQVHAQDVNTNTLVSRELVYGEEEVVKWARAFNTKANLFVGRNPRDKNGKVAGITCVSLDIDPVREPKRASLPEQFERAISTAHQIKSVEGVGVSGVVLCSSGNGALLIFPFDSVQADVSELTQQIKEFEHGIIERFSTSEVRIDATFDAPRLVKVMGSLSVKGEQSLWRYAKFLQPVLSGLGRGSQILERIRRITVPESPVVLPSFRAGDYDSRSEADFGMAVRLQQAGLGPEACYAELLKFSHRNRPDDARRIVTKLYANGNSNVVGTRETPPKPLELWTPGVDYEAELQKRADTRADRVVTGFDQLDEHLYELPKGELSTFAARSGYGKTSFAVSMCEFLRLRGRRILFFSTEVNRFRIFDKFVSVAKSITGFELTSGQLSERSREQLGKYKSETNRSPVYICDDPSPTVQGIKEKVNEIKPDLFVFDHINWIASDRLAVREYFKGLKQIAADFKIPGIVFAQLNEPPRDLQHGGFMDSSRADIRESKDLITDSAVLVFWQNHNQPDGPIQKVKVTIAKGRYGGMDESCFLEVDKRYGRFQKLVD